MAAKPYRWHAIESLRKARRVQAQHAVTRAQADVQRATLEVDEAQQQLQAHLARTPASLTSAVASSALELQRAAAHALTHTQAVGVLRARVQQVTAKFASANEALAAARQVLAHSRGEQRVIERDRARALRMTRRKQEGVEHAEVEDMIAERTRRSS